MNLVSRAVVAIAVVDTAAMLCCAFFGMLSIPQLAIVALIVSITMIAWFLATMLFLREAVHDADRWIVLIAGSYLAGSAFVGVGGMLWSAAENGWGSTNVDGFFAWCWIYGAVFFAPLLITGALVFPPLGQKGEGTRGFDVTRINERTNSDREGGSQR